MQGRWWLKGASNAADKNIHIKNAKGKRYARCAQEITN
jgi:hypothetical protein